MKIGLYLENKNIGDIDLSKPENGNPGIGGTQYNFITLPYYFFKYIPDKVRFVWYANVVDNLPQNIESIKVEDALDAAKKAEKDNCDILIWRPTGDISGERFIEEIDSYNIKIIAWVHNTPKPKLLDKINKSKQIKRFVCVSQEQLDCLRDHDIFYKSTCIFNGFDYRKYVPTKEVKKEGKYVVYVGSLIPAKGFHYLARVWPEIKKRKTDARLIIIGSGKLYNRNQKLGKWGIAEESYEREWRRYLGNENGEIDKSVDFKGVLGDEKIEILQKADVGVVNPSGATENCPGSAIEFQAAKTPVVSGAYNGLLDTVINNKTGFLGKSDKNLINNILYLLKDKEMAAKFGENGFEFIKEKFNYKNISYQWLELFEEVYYEKPNKIKFIKQFPFENYKFLKEIIRFINKYVPILKLPPISKVKDKVKNIIIE
ncbi:MAG: glycosyltransferase family 4 protein [Clostridiales bacterium]|nr:glycosyltransferase family 4 protein [Clostridiales bacterium]MCF8023162.1 glycosyltransferase family 4 protein [Clostridiales bacterium]